MFEIAKTADGYAAPTTLVNFNGTNGAEPISGLIADAYGDLFGTTSIGGNFTTNFGYGLGTVFEITKTDSGYASTPTTLVAFNGTDGGGPNSSLIADANGDLFGTTGVGGSAGYNPKAPNSFGTVFEITKTDSGYASTPTTLVTFNRTDGNSPNSLIADANGDLFGTTYSGGAYDGYGYYGTVFEIVKTAHGYASTPTTLVNFNDANGSEPTSLIADAHGDLFGTTAFGGLGEPTQRNVEHCVGSIPTIQPEGNDGRD